MTSGLLLQIQAAIGILALGLGLVFFETAAAAPPVTAHFSQVGETLHLELQGQTQWDYNLEKRSEKKGMVFEIEVPTLSPAATEELKAFHSPTVQSLAIRHNGSDGRDVLVVKVTDSDWEAFDYLTDQPSRLIVDFFRAPKSQRASDKKVENSAPKEKTGPKAAKSQTGKVAQVKAAIKRQPTTADHLTIAQNGAVSGQPIETSEAVAGANQSGIFDGGDPLFERFKMKDYEIKEDPALAQQQNTYVHFPMLKVEDGMLEMIREQAPLYEIHPQDSEENKQARLLLTLFENKRYNVFLKAVNWFTEKYPDSQYNEVIWFMWADTYFSLWQQDRQQGDFELAMLRYRQALQKFPQSALMERTKMLMGYASLDRGDVLGTLRLFQQHIIDRPQSPNRDLARLAMAKTFGTLAQYDEAQKLYAAIEQEGTQKKYQVAAAYLRGDVEFQRGDYPKAIEFYQKAIEKYPEGAGSYPNAYYNQAAAYFEQKKSKESLTTYLNFLKLYPKHTYAGFAMTRVGELLHLLGADSAKVMGAYLETYFRYGDSPSAAVARLRLLTGRMAGMKDKEVEKAVNEVKEITQKSQLPGIEQFANVLIAEGFANRKEYDKAIDVLTKYYQANPTTADTQFLSNQIVRDINAKIQDQVANGQYLEALKTHSTYANNRLKGTERIDTQYFVAKAFEEAGDPKEAERLYRDSLNHLMGVRDPAELKARSSSEKLPTVDALNLRLAVTQARLGQDVKAYETMRTIQKPELLSEPEQIERVQLASRLLEKKGDMISASRYLSELIRTWKGIPELVAPPYLQLGELEVKSGQTDEALKSFRRIDQLMQDSGGLVPASVHEKALEKMSDLLIQTKKPEQAAPVLQALLDNYEKKWPLSSYRYQLGKIFFEKGELAKANEIWTGLKNEKASIWYELAQEQLKNSSWNDDYKKYIKRIPAMSKKE